MDGVGDPNRSDGRTPLPPRDNTKPPPNFSLFLRPSLFSKSKPSRDLACGASCSVPKALAGPVTETGPPQLRTCDPELKAGVDGNFKQRVSSGLDSLGIPGPDKRFLEPSSLMRAPDREGRNLPRSMGPSCDPCIPAMSAFSQGASNQPMVSLKRRYEECRSSSQSHSDSDDSARFDRAAASTKDRGSSARRSSERIRRGRINQKLRTLQDLLPNCNKVDQAGILDEAIEYLKTLQQQFLVLSTGSPMYMSPPPPPVMLPAGIPQMYAPYPGQFPMIGAGLQFPIPPGPRTAGLGLQLPVPRTLPFAQATGCSSARSLSPDYSRPTDSAGDLVDTSDQSDTSCEDEF